MNFGKKRKAALFDPALFSRIDMIEVLNGHMADHRNFKAFMLSEVFEKSAMAGSDAHRPEDIGKIFMRFDRRMDRQGVYDLLHFPIKLGITEKYSIAKFARNVAQRHPDAPPAFLLEKTPARVDDEIRRPRRVARPRRARRGGRPENVTRNLPTKRMEDGCVGLSRF
ncbi:MAG: hypothetical protein M5R36_10380 [Deltaproteobacteria bacterium]|nr:hypothetical protein [Deltaproteobacteria bacterium]